MFKNYFKIAERQIAFNKSFFFINITGLAFSLAGAILIFTIIRYHLSFDNFHPQSDRIYRFVTEMHRDHISYSNNVPNPLGKYFHHDYSLAEKVARIVTFPNQPISIVQQAALGKFQEAAEIAFTEPEFFDIFNYPLLRGDADSLLSEPNTAVLTENTAKKYFGDTDPIHQTFRLDNKFEFKVTGILKDFPVNTDRQTGIYASFISLKTIDPWFYSDDSWYGISSQMQCFVRLKPQVTISEVEELLPGYIKRFMSKSKNVYRYKLQPLADIHFDKQYGGVVEKSSLWMLALVAVFLIITACVNYVNLSVSQVLKRFKEVGLRKLMGGKNAQLYWQFIVETTMVCLAGMLMAIAMCYILFPHVNSFFNTGLALKFTEPPLLLFLLSLGLIITFLAGSYPGMVLAGFRPIEALKGKLTSRGVSSLNSRRIIVVIQFAVSQILLIGMFVIIKQVHFAKHADLGFDKEALVMVPLGADSTGQLKHDLAKQLRKMNGISQVSLCYAAPGSNEDWYHAVKFDHRSEDVKFRTIIKTGDENYIPLFGLDLVAGRNIYPSGTLHEFIVNETFAHKVNLDPEAMIGKYMATGSSRLAGPIVGVVKDFHNHSFREAIDAVAITNFNQDYENEKYAIKLNGKEVGKTLNEIEELWTRKHPDQLFSYKFVDESIARFYDGEKKMLAIVQLFSALAILISCLGAYGMICFMVGQKTKEIGIRKVMGRSLSQTLWTLGKEFIRLILIAFVIAAPIGWWLMHDWLKDFRFRIQIDPWIFATVMLLMLIISLLTISYQAIKAAIAKPVKSLRTE